VTGACPCATFRLGVGVLYALAAVLGIVGSILTIFYGRSAFQMYRDYLGPRRGELSGSTLDSVNSRFRGKVLVRGSLRQVPVVRVEGALTLPAELEKRARALRATLPVNDPHAFIRGNPSWGDEPLHFTCKSADFAAVQALREASPPADWPKILSASVLPVCDARSTIYLHRRSQKSKTCPGRLHTFGGGFMPLIKDQQGRYDVDLLSCAEREFREETNIGFVSRRFPIVACEELDTQFVQVVFLGVGLEGSEVDRQHANWEGRVVEINYRELLEQLVDDRAGWCPSGKVHVLLWLSMGAPGSSRRRWPVERSPRATFDQVLKV
jgi:ADP-ribose pyrophosphatase YjhB (NUDIX family)